MPDEQSLSTMSAGEIFWKNFLVGFSRSLGAILVQGVFFVVLTIITIRLMAPLLSSFSGIMKGLSPASQMTSPASMLDQFDTSITR